MKCVLAAILLTVSLSGQAFTRSTFQGLVVQVHDGDTLTVMNEMMVPERVRVDKIDSPEMPYTFAGVKVPYQPYASESRSSLLNLCLSRVATVLRVGRSGSRTVGRVSCEGSDVASWQLTTGSAWVYHYGSTVKSRALMGSARTAKRGLWAADNPIDPYFWRRGVR